MVQAPRDPSDVARRGGSIKAECRECGRVALFAPGSWRRIGGGSGGIVAALTSSGIYAVNAASADQRCHGFRATHRPTMIRHHQGLRFRVSGCRRSWVRTCFRSGGAVEDECPLLVESGQLVRCALRNGQSDDKQHSDHDHCCKSKEAEHRMQRGCPRR